MGGLVSSIFGPSAAEKQQMALLSKQQADQAAVEAGQEKLRMGGGSGLLAYTGPSDDRESSAMPALRGLNRLLSGAS